MKLTQTQMIKEEVRILYINQFDFKNEDLKELMRGKPEAGALYRCFYVEDKVTIGGPTKAEQAIIDNSHYRIIMEDPSMKISNLILRDLCGEDNDWAWDVVVVNDDNITDLELDPDQYKKLAVWRKTLHSDIDNLRALIEDEEDEAIDTVVARGHNPNNDENMDRNKIEEFLGKEPEEALEEELDGDFDVLDSLDSLETINISDVPMAIVLNDFLSYIASTYDDKYADPNNVFNTKDMLYNDEYGKPISIFNAMKYTQRYLTSGYDKSENPQDLYKAVHYLLFELIRKFKQSNGE